MKLTIKTADDLAAERDATVRAKELAEARAYLAATDWYVTRRAETKKPIPKDVAEKRKAAREVLS